MKSLRSLIHIFKIVGLLVSVSAAAASDSDSVEIKPVEGSAKLSVLCTVDTTTGECILASARSTSWVLDVPDFKNDKSVIGAIRVGQSDFVGESLPITWSREFVDLHTVIGGLGSDVLGKRDLTYDFAKIYAPEMKLYFHAMPLFRQTARTISQRLSSQPTVISIVIQGKRLKALWDTEAQTSFSPKFAAENPEFVNQSLKLLGHEIGKLPVAPVDSNYDITLGIDVIRSFTWTFPAQGNLYAVVSRLQ